MEWLYNNSPAGCQRKCSLRLPHNVAESLPDQPPEQSICGDALDGSGGEQFKQPLFLSAI